MRVRVIEPKEKTLKKRKTCAYARVSTDSEKQGESLENQVSYYENLITSNPKYEFIGVFADQGITGTTENRPEFQKMLEFCRQGKIDLIITKSISRFARNTTVMLQTVRELKEIGVEVRFEKENINTLSGDGELMLTVLSSFAEEESRSVSENIKWRYHKKFKNGELVINTNRFLGYDKDENGDLIINEKEASIVRRIFQEYLSGKGTFKIAKLFNQEGIPTVTGSKWNETTILAVLKNEKYKGDAILQKTFIMNHLNKLKKKNIGQLDSYYIEENHPVIIPKEMWDKVQNEIKNRAEAKGIYAGTNKYQNRYQLTGLLYCNKCKATLRRRTWNSKHACRKIVWQCSNYIKNGKDACTGISIDDETISKVNIQEPTFVEEVIKNGKKHYSYTRKGEQDKSSSGINNTEKENGSLLQGINRPIRTVIKL
ncbi:Site-specific recombinase [Candidatus Syntrophocurvum alkaliphilum]|uniref:Site-specific recombinase n=1 Tax=Candidatus Syntrophocurvum alkaliphilum TaxID=2293317 RepID=A0A6I6DAY2_9FIRM|nr:recombinase family protein [Candidatus Syntrophocurvum alkaliphilum]QGT99489.1 Site-specific recombinase [Candidatus Syntrophocurvum alkaliphilum]